MTSETAELPPNTGAIEILPPASAPMPCLRIGFRRNQEELLYSFVLPPIRPRGGTTLEHPAVDAAINLGSVSSMLDQMHINPGPLAKFMDDKSEAESRIEDWNDGKLPEEVYHFQFAERVSFFTSVATGSPDLPVVTIALFTNPAVMAAGRENQVRPSLSFGLGATLFRDFVRHLRGMT